MKTLRTPARTRPARTSPTRAASWLAAGLMVVVAAFGPGASPSFAANLHANDPESDSETAGSVTSISVAPCFDAEGISGTLAVTVTASPFVFDVWVTDHVPGGGDWLPVPGSLQTLTATVSDGALRFGPLSVASHRDGVNSFRVETNGGNAKSSSVSACESETPFSPLAAENPPTDSPPTDSPPTENPPAAAEQPTENPPTENPPTENPPATDPPATEDLSSPPPSEQPTDPPAVDNPPTENPPTATEQPAEVVPVSQDQLPQPETSDAPTGEVLGAVSAPQPTPRVTLPPTDTLSTTAAGSTPIPGWRLILVGLAGLIVSLLLLSSDRTARRRS